MALTEMVSVVFTPKQMKAIEAQARAEGRKVGNLIRYATVKYLKEAGILEVDTAVDDDSADDSNE